MKDFLAVVGVGALCYLSYQGYKKYLADPVSDELIRLAKNKEKVDSDAKVS